jgi:hypothetical protein
MLAALWICTLFGWVLYESAAAVQRCINATEQIAFETWVIMLLYSVSVMCALVWTQFTVSATVLVGTKVTRKAMLKQEVNPYTQM